MLAVVPRLPSWIFRVVREKRAKERDTIWDAILTCARKPTWDSLIYCAELTTKKCKNRKTTSRKQICWDIPVNSPGNPCSESWRRKRKGCGGKDLQKRKVLNLEWKSEWVMEYQIIVSMTVGKYGMPPVVTHAARYVVCCVQHSGGPCKKLGQSRCRLEVDFLVGQGTVYGIRWHARLKVVTALCIWGGLWLMLSINVSQYVMVVVTLASQGWSQWMKYQNCAIG